MYRRHLTDRHQGARCLTHSTLIVGWLVAAIVMALPAWSDDPPAAVDLTQDPLPAGAVTRIGLFGKGAGYVGIYITAMTPDGKLLATRSSDQIVRVWEIATGKNICELDGHEGRVMDIAFSPDGRYLVTSSPGARESIVLWDPKTGEEVQRFPGGARRVQFNDGSDVLRFVDDRHCGSVKLATGARVSSGVWPTGPSESPLAMSADGKWLATYNHRTNLRPQQLNILIRLVERSQSKGQVVLGGVTAQPVSGQFSPDGRHFVGCFRGKNEALLWSLNRPRQAVALSGHTQRVQDITFSHDGRLIATASWDTTVTIWESMTARPIATLQGHREHVCAVSFSPNDQQLATGASGRSDNSAVIWDIRKRLLETGDSPQPDEQALDALWQQLASSDPAEGYAAIGRLLAVPDQASALFQIEVDRVAQRIDRETLQKLIRDLDDDRFVVRQAAHQELERLRTVAEPLLQAALKNAPSAEVYYRITKILATNITDASIPENELFRLRRMILTLELMGTDVARSQLSAMSTGHSHSDVIRDAAAALQRLEKSDGV